MTMSQRQRQVIWHVLALAIITAAALWLLLASLGCAHGIETSYGLKVQSEYPASTVEMVEREGQVDLAAVLSADLEATGVEVTRSWDPATGTFQYTAKAESIGATRSRLMAILPEVIRARAEQLGVAADAIDGIVAAVIRAMAPGL